MKKLTKKIPIGNKIRYISVLVGDECQDPNQKRASQWNMIQTIANTPDLMTCGTVPFEKMAMRYNGTEWVVEMEAEVTGG